MSDSKNSKSNMGKAQRDIKRNKSMLIKSTIWIMGGFIIGFISTLGVSMYYAWRLGFADALGELFIVHMNFMAGMEVRSPHAANLLSWLESYIPQLSMNFSGGYAFTSIWNELQYAGYGVLALAEWSLKVDLVKFASVLCSALIFVLAGILGIMDGLYGRYIRTAEGGRESTYVYHHLSDWFFRVPFCLGLAYMAFPFPINPLIVVIFLALLIFVFCRVSASTLKKFI